MKEPKMTANEHTYKNTENFLKKNENGALQNCTWRQTKYKFNFSAHFLSTDSLTITNNILFESSISGDSGSFL